MDYKNLYLKYKTKYLILKNNQSGGTPDSSKIHEIDDYIKSQILDKNLAIKAKKNKTTIISSPNDALVLKPIYTYYIVYPFIFRYLLEYGFSIAELKTLINNGAPLHNIFKLLSYMHGITNISNRRESIKNLVAIGIWDPINDLPKLLLLEMFIFDNNILLNSVELKIFLNYLKTYIMLNRDRLSQFSKFIYKNRTCATFILNNILNNPTITIEQLINTTKM
jgi:hypothetical protein